MASARTESAPHAPLPPAVPIPHTNKFKFRGLSVGGKKGETAQCKVREKGADLILGAKSNPTEEEVCQLPCMRESFDCARKCFPKCITLGSTSYPAQARHVFRFAQVKALAQIWADHMREKQPDKYREYYNLAFDETHASKKMKASISASSKETQVM
jgi:hypothetical protein